METVVLALGIATTVLAVWGMVAPRGFWNSLFGWSFADQRAGEPGASSYLVRRLLLALGLASVATIGIVVTVQGFMNPPRVAPPPTAIEQMWGPGNHAVVNRVVTPTVSVPGGVVEMPVLGYQAIGEDGPGDYLRLLPQFSILGQTALPGLIGAPPSEGYGATDTAELILQVRGPLLCIPKVGLVIETPETVTVAIYYGVPDGAVDSDGVAMDNVADCPVDAPVTASTLIPIELAADLGERQVLTLTGETLPEVALVD